MTRAARETLSDYGRRSYYEVWAAALWALLAERDLVSEEEVLAADRFGLHAGWQENCWLRMFRMRWRVALLLSERRRPIHCSGSASR